MPLIDITVPTQSRPTKNTVWSALKERAPGTGVRRIYLSDIISAVVRHFKTPKKDILSEKRSREFVYPRQLAMYLAKQLTMRSLPEIGRNFDGRDHTTVLHSVRKIENLLSGNNERALGDILAILHILDSDPANDNESEDTEVVTLNTPSPDAAAGRPRRELTRFTPRTFKPSFEDVRRATCDIFGIEGLEGNTEEAENGRCICCLVVKNYSKAKEMHEAGRAIGSGYMGVIRYSRIAERQLATTPAMATMLGKLLHQLGITPYDKLQ